MMGFISQDVDVVCWENGGEDNSVSACRSAIIVLSVTVRATKLVLALRLCACLGRTTSIHLPTPLPKDKVLVVYICALDNIMHTHTRRTTFVITIICV